MIFSFGYEHIKNTLISNHFFVNTKNDSDLWAYQADKGCVMAKGMSLVKAYLTNAIPPEGGFIVTGFFRPNSFYSIYEITAYKNVKDIYRNPDGITFKTDGSRTHLLIEPATYTQKYIEPVNREDGLSIPYRFSEMEIISGTKSEKIMVPNEPLSLYSSFTILEKKSDYLAYLFWLSADVYIAMSRFLADTFYNDCNLAKSDAKKSAEQVLSTVKKFTIWE